MEILTEKNSIKELQIHKETEIEQMKNHKELGKYILSEHQETENSKESQKRTEYKESNAKTHPTNDKTHPTNDEKKPKKKNITIIHTMSHGLLLVLLLV